MCSCVFWGGGGASVAGVQPAVLPEILGQRDTRNCLARFSIISTDEGRSLDERDPEELGVDMQLAWRHVRDCMGATLEVAWEGQSDDPCLKFVASEGVVRLLTHAANAVKRAAREFGQAGDPLLQWSRKVDENSSCVTSSVWRWRRSAT